MMSTSSIASISCFAVAPFQDGGGMVVETLEDLGSGGCGAVPYVSVAYQVLGVLLVLENSVRFVCMPCLVLLLQYHQEEVLKGRAVLDVDTLLLMCAICT